MYSVFFSCQMPGYQDTRTPELHLYYNYCSTKNHSTQFVFCYLPALLVVPVAIDIIPVL